MIMDKMSEGKKGSFAGRLEKGRKIREAGFKTAIHASPHKDKIDNWILEKSWSSRTIVNELNRLYPDEEHPSYKAIDNYREKYLQTGGEIKGLLQNSSKENLLKLSDYIKQFHDEIDELFKGVVVARKRIYFMVETEEKTKIPMKAMNEALAKYFEAVKILTNTLQSAGVLNMPMDSVSATTDEIDINNLELVRKEVDRIERVVAFSKKRGIDIKFD